jgi:hypothetical protein
MFSLPALRDEGILEGFRLHRERTRWVRPALPAKSIPVPSSSNLCVLCVSAFSSPNVDALDAASSISPMFATLTKNTWGWVSIPIINTNSQFNRRLTSNSHRITSFADPHPLNPIESYSCKKQGEGVPLTPSRRRGTSYLCATRRNTRKFNLFMGLLHNSRTPRGGGTSLAVVLTSSLPYFAFDSYLTQTSLAARGLSGPTSAGTGTSPPGECPPASASAWRSHEESCAALQRLPPAIAPGTIGPW